jgi:hypothetical protein
MVARVPAGVYYATPCVCTSSAAAHCNTHRTFLGAVHCRTHSQVVVSHKRAILSSPPVSSHLPSGLLAIAWMRPSFCASSPRSAGPTLHACVLVPPV